MLLAFSKKARQFWDYQLCSLLPVFVPLLIKTKKRKRNSIFDCNWFQLRHIDRTAVTRRTRKTALTPVPHIIDKLQGHTELSAHRVAICSMNSSPYSKPTVLDESSTRILERASCVTGTVATTVYRCSLPTRYSPVSNATAAAYYAFGNVLRCRLVPVNKGLFHSNPLQTGIFAALACNGDAAEGHSQDKVSSRARWWNCV